VPESFDPDMFLGTVVFYPPGTVPEQHGDPVIGAEDLAAPPPAGSVRFSPDDLGGAIPWGNGGASVESEAQGRGQRSEVHYTPEGSRNWLVHTGADPHCGTDWLVVWNGRLLRVTAAPAAADGWALWQTPCSEVT
jgi:hypothetical protein